MPRQNIPSEWGPQGNDKKSFTKKCRLLQSWYRYEKLGKTEYGIGPEEHSADQYGNMLVGGGIDGCNFLDNDIFNHVTYRLENKLPGETLEPFRLVNNMLSSQPMCFNLFYPLQRLFENDPEKASIIISKCFPDIYLKKIISIEIERALLPQQLYLNDKTAFDVLIVFDDIYGGNAILGIETKYTDPLGKKRSSDIKPQIALVEECGLFTDEGMDGARKGFGQLGRNFLLALKYEYVHGLSISYSAVISPEENSAENEINNFRGLLKDGSKDRIFYKSLEELMGDLRSFCPAEMQQWINDFNTRYLDFTPITNYI